MYYYLLNLGLIDTFWIPPACFAYAAAFRAGIEIFHTLYHTVHGEKSPVCRQAGFQEIISGFITGYFSAFALILCCAFTIVNLYPRI